MKKSVLIVIGSALYNRGSEALLTGLVKMCKMAGATTVVSCSGDLKGNQKLQINELNNSIPRYISIYHNKIFKKITSIMRMKFGASDIVTKIISRNLITNVNDFDLIIIVGADNLDRKVNYKKEIYSLSEIINKKSDAKLLLYDCSISKKNIDKHLMENLNYYDAITARDKISFNNLRETYSKSNLFYMPDPAFIIEAEYVELDILNIDNTVGINVSNLIVGDENSNNYKIILNSYKVLMRNIIDKTDMNILLIPHVMNNADLSILRILYAQFKDSKRVNIIENEKLNAKQLKYIISKCRFFVGARTHATIAAYSSCVPTLVLGYSIKSVGIANDLFDTDENYVVSHKNLKTENDLLEKFIWIQNNEISIREKLEFVIPSYKDKVLETINLISELLEN